MTQNTVLENMCGNQGNETNLYATAVVDLSRFLRIPLKGHFLGRTTTKASGAARDTMLSWSSLPQTTPHPLYPYASQCSLAIQYECHHKPTHSHQARIHTSNQRRIGMCPELSGRIAIHFNGNSFAQFVLLKTKTPEVNSFCLLQQMPMGCLNADKRPCF